MIRFRTDFEKIVERNRVIAEVVFHLVVVTVFIMLSALIFFGLPDAIDQELQRSSGVLSECQRSQVVARWEVR